MFNRVRAFCGPRAEEKAEKVGHFFKALVGDEESRAWCIGHRVPLVKATAESVNTTGGYLTPLAFDEAILTIRETYGAFRRGTQVRPTSSDNQVRPRWVSGLSANFVAEGSPIPESSLTLDAVGTSQKKLAILARSSAEIFEDSPADVGEFLTSEIGFALAQKEDDCGFNGDGSSTFSGISGLAAKLVGLKSAVAAASGHNTYATIDSVDVSNLMAGVLGSALASGGAAFYCSQLAYAQTLCRLAAAAGGHTERVLPDGTVQLCYLGFPVFISGKLPNTTSSLTGKAMLYFGDLRMASVIVERNSQIVVATSRERAIDADQILIRGVSRLDIVVHDVGDTANVGPIAALIGTA